MAARRALARHARGRLDADTLARHLDTLERRVAALRRTHWMLDAVTELLGQPWPLGRPVVTLLLLALASLWLRR